MLGLTQTVLIVTFRRNDVNPSDGASQFAKYRRISSIFRKKDSQQLDGKLQTVPRAMADFVSSNFQVSTLYFEKKFQFQFWILRKT